MEVSLEVSGAKELLEDAGRAGRLLHLQQAVQSYRGYLVSLPSITRWTGGEEGGGGWI